ncbi:MAG: tRNA (uridine(34)/cytosine(34)/5-carboxymethylaminomethyluridine(34)-2'-O)-methyltransferase TrmL [Gammaproteobacteria bacterium]|nr:tRNA (uridine(34)/cytosine(34)/5-carboxymethylaminomethyluridine(34)-2'-O)-methyltransferase TrmL [Gammaproteobacteria bacterium]
MSDTPETNATQPWLHVVLHEPEIPPNTGNVIRLCANTGTRLHLIHPLGFEINEKAVRRSGMDYREMAPVEHHDSYEAFLETVKPARVFAIETGGTSSHVDVNYQVGDALIFGNEGSGLPQRVMDNLPNGEVLTLPMMPNTRSLNLSNTVAIAVYEAWRQLGFSIE